MSTAPHRRFNPLTREWVLVSPQRMARPWQGEQEVVHAEAAPRYDPGCPLCPGNARSSGVLNPDYRGTFAFRNDFPALTFGGEEAFDAHPVFRTEPVRGDCWVVCTSHDHSASLNTMSLGEIEAVMRALAGHFGELAQRFEWVQIFENCGAAMGASSPHPHAQIWAMDAMPTRASKIAESIADEPDLLLRVMEAEFADGQRVIWAGDHWLIWVPFWAEWPFETMVASRRRVRTLLELDDAEWSELGVGLSVLLGAYDRLFQAPFPYSFGWMNAPAEPTRPWHLFGQFLPPLLRSASVRKHMVGFELLCEAQRDLTPEEAAWRLRRSAEEGTPSRGPAN